MKKGIIAVGFATVVVVAVFVVGWFLHRDNNPEETSGVLAAGASDVQSVIESIDAETPAPYVPETTEGAVVESSEQVEETLPQSALQQSMDTMMAFIFDDPIMSLYFTEDDVKMQVVEGGTLIYLDNCDKVEYEYKEVDMIFLEEATGDVLPNDGMLSLKDWVHVYHNRTSMPTEEYIPGQHDGGFFTDGDGEAITGYTKHESAWYNSEEAYGEFPDVTVEEQFEPEFCRQVLSTYGNYDPLQNFMNVINMVTTFEGPQWVCETVRMDEEVLSVHVTANDKQFYFIQNIPNNTLDIYLKD